MHVPQSSRHDTRHGLVTPVRLGLTTAGQAGHKETNLLLDDGPFGESLCDEDNDDILCPDTPLPVTTVRMERRMNCKDDSSTAGVCPDRYWAHAVTSTPEPSMGRGTHYKEPTDKLSPITNINICSTAVTTPQRDGMKSQEDDIPPNRPEDIPPSSTPYLQKSDNLTSKHPPPSTVTGGVAVGQGEVTGARRKGEECLRVKEGICLDHGGVAQKKWRLEWKTVRDAKGKTTKVKTRKYYWICAFRKEERWSQTVLSFAGTARRDTIKTPDTTQGRGGDTE